MAHRIVVVMVLALLASGGCLVANPAFDGVGPGNATTSLATSTSLTDAMTTGAVTDAASTAGVDTTAADIDEPASTGEGATELVLEASKTYPPKAKWYPGVLELDVPTAVLLPPTMMVTVGNAGNHTTILRLTLADLGEVQCTYKGGGSHRNPKPDDGDWDKGLSYDFLKCDDGAMAGDMRTVVKLTLNIQNGASMQPPAGPQTTVLAVLPKA